MQRPLKNLILLWFFRGMPSLEGVPVLRKLGGGNKNPVFVPKCRKMGTKRPYLFPKSGKTPENGSLGNKIEGFVPKNPIPGTELPFLFPPPNLASLPLHLVTRRALLGRAGEEGRHQDKHGPGDKTELKIIDCISAAVLYICKFKGQNNTFQYET